MSAFPWAFDEDHHPSYQGDEEQDVSIIVDTSTVPQQGAFDEDYVIDLDSQMEDAPTQSVEEMCPQPEEPEKVTEVVQVSNSKKRSFEELNEDTELTEDEAEDSMIPAKRIKIDESIPMETESVAEPQINEMSDDPRSENVLASDSKDEAQIVDDQPPIDVIEASIGNEECQIPEITEECEPSIPVIDDVKMDVDSEDIKSDDTAATKTKKKTATKTKKATKSTKSTISKAKKSSAKKASKVKKSTKSKKAKTPKKKATRSKKKSIAKKSTKKKVTKRKVTKKKASKKTVSRKKKTVSKRKKTTKKAKRTVSRKKKPASKKRKTASKKKTVSRKKKVSKKKKVTKPRKTTKKKTTKKRGTKKGTNARKTTKSKKVTKKKATKKGSSKRKN